MTWVAILMGSESDWPVMQGASQTLESLAIRCEVRVTSAHRTPQATAEYVTGAEERGCAVYICGAGMAAHLAGAVAAMTIKPVIGVPMESGPLAGFDALLSTVQMPGGIPVATVAIGKPGAKNAGYLAAQILALNDLSLAARLRADRSAGVARVVEQNERLQQQRSAES
jgi:5-(carboxyamino)imidazole ribonucleotide mutase